ncbi:MAG: hypothetical protein ACRDQF_12225, partial [Thermocrispum sp.]
RVVMACVVVMSRAPSEHHAQSGRRYLNSGRDRDANDPGVAAGCSMSQVSTCAAWVCGGKIG